MNLPQGRFIASQLSPSGRVNYLLATDHRPRPRAPSVTIYIVAFDVAHPPVTCSMATPARNRDDAEKLLLLDYPT